MPQVRDLMVSDVVTIEPGTSVVDAAKRMIQEEKGPLPIVEGDRPVAIVTDRDLVAHVVAEGRDPSSTTVDDIATRDLVTIGPDQDVNDARQLMDQHQLDRILVVEGDRLVGIISEADIRSDETPLARSPSVTDREEEPAPIQSLLSFIGLPAGIGRTQSAATGRLAKHLLRRCAWHLAGLSCRTTFSSTPRGRGR